MQRHIADIRHEITAHPAHSAWGKGIRSYAEELFCNYIEGLHITDENTRLGKIAEKDLLNGAKDWLQYSYSNSS